MSRRAKDRSNVVGTSKPRLLNVLGPGLVTGAADDDPSGIATYAQAGAQFGFSLGWTLILTYPFMVVIQSICARIGRTTGLGIAGNVRRHYPKWLLNGLVATLTIANVCNIGADLGAMAEASRLLIPMVPSWILLGAFAMVCAGGQIFMHHKRYVATLKWLTLSLFAYFAVLCVVHVPWPQFFLGLLWPRLTPSKEFWLMVAAILGTTISPYLFFWQAAQEVEDTKTEPIREPLLDRPAQGENALARIRLDTVIGMGISNLVALAIMATAAATLHASNIKEIESAAQAAEALRPLAGEFAFSLFSLGIIGTGLLSVPVLAGSAAYALGEARRWPVGLSRQPQQAKAFYGTIAVATLVGTVANALKVSPIKALVWSAVLNAIAAAPIMVLLMQMATNPAVMGKFTISRRSRAVGWLATLVMAVASLGFIISFGFS
ncbi:MAG TPA: divalent metal cation transporter [Steroidobacteraceae bacterium]|jgi:NRAMP (natural resistance-associated macrophage protein)-like metal ion transporter|nr:divalent metal cation transporter [Steroidobacteraceae bacterium]